MPRASKSECARGSGLPSADGALSLDPACGDEQEELSRVLSAQGTLLERVRSLDEAQRASDEAIEARIREAHDAVAAAHAREAALREEVEASRTAAAEAAQVAAAEGGDEAAQQLAAARAEAEKYKERLATVSAKESQHTARISELEEAVGGAIKLTQQNRAQMEGALGRRDERMRELEELLLTAEAEREKAVELCDALRQQVEAGSAAQAAAAAEGEGGEGVRSPPPSSGGENGLSAEDAVELLETLSQSEREREKAIQLAEDLHAQLGLHQEKLEQSEGARGQALDLCERTSDELRKMRDMMGVNAEEKVAATEACEALTEQLRAQVARAEAAEAKLAAVHAQGEDDGEEEAGASANAAVESAIEKVLEAERREHAAQMTALVGKMQGAVHVVEMLQYKMAEAEQAQDDMAAERREHADQVQDLAHKLQRAVEVVSLLEDRAETAEARVAALEGGAREDGPVAGEGMPPGVDQTALELAALLEAERNEHAATVSDMTEKMQKALEVLHLLQEQMERAEMLEVRAVKAERRCVELEAAVASATPADEEAEEDVDEEPEPPVQTQAQAVEADAAAYYAPAQRPQSRFERPLSAPHESAAGPVIPAGAQPLRARVPHRKRIPGFMAPTLAWSEAHPRRARAVAAPPNPVVQRIVGGHRFASSSARFVDVRPHGDHDRRGRAVAF